MDNFSDYAQWLHNIIRPDKILLSIRDAARAGDVTDTQVRYWIKNHFLKTVKAENGAIKLPYGEIAKIRMIKSFLDSGYTLSAAAKKTQENADLARSFSHLVLAGIQHVERKGKTTIFDLGPIENDPEKHIFVHETPEKITYEIKHSED